jgi:hypothetical protein
MENTNMSKRIAPERPRRNTRRWVTAGTAAVLAGTFLATTGPAQALIAGAMPVSMLSAPKMVLPPKEGRIPAGAHFAAMTPQRSCDPVAKPGVIKFRDLMLSTYSAGRNGGIVRSCFVGGGSEHKEGRAWDWMINQKDPAQARAATHAINFLMAPGPDGQPAWQARRLGIMYMVYNHKIWSSSRPADGWRAYKGASDHTDHVHFSFSWAGAMGQTVFWTGKQTPTNFGPCLTGSTSTCTSLAKAAAPVSKSPARTEIVQRHAGVELDFGSTGEAVRDLQRLLRMPESDWDGIYGTKTREALLTFKRHATLGKATHVRSLTWEALTYPYNPAQE